MAESPGAERCMLEKALAGGAIEGHLPNYLSEAERVKTFRWPRWTGSRANYFICAEATSGSVCGCAHIRYLQCQALPRVAGRAITNVNCACLTPVWRRGKPRQQLAGLRQEESQSKRF